jgi:hypothetical protein
MVVMALAASPLPLRAASPIRGSAADEFAKDVRIWIAGQRKSLAAPSWDVAARSQGHRCRMFGIVASDLTPPLLRSLSSTWLTSAGTDAPVDRDGDGDLLRCHWRWCSHRPGLSILDGDASAPTVITR